MEQTLELLQRVEMLEASVADIRRRLAAPPEPEPPRTPVHHPSEESWALDGLRQMAQDSSAAIMFAGFSEAEGPVVGPVRWQYARSGDAIMDRDWGAAAPALGALGSPIRLRILQLIAAGMTATADLVADGGLGTTGQLHHHLKALMAGGWLRSPSRGHYEVPPSRLVPLLVIVTATETT